jgi:hypothetical protein
MKKQFKNKINETRTVKKILSYNFADVESTLTGPFEKIYRKTMKNRNLKSTTMEVKGDEGVIFYMLEGTPPKGFAIASSRRIIFYGSLGNEIHKAEVNFDNLLQETKSKVSDSND